MVENYNCFRSFRRASDTRSMEKVSITDIEMVNCWGKEERARNNIKLSMPMRQHYAQPELLIEPFWQYTTTINRIHDQLILFCNSNLVFKRKIMTTYKGTRIDWTSEKRGIE